MGKALPHSPAGLLLITFILLSSCLHAPARIYHKIISKQKSGGLCADGGRWVGIYLDFGFEAKAEGRLKFKILKFSQFLLYSDKGVKIIMQVLEALYKNGILRIVKPEKIDSNLVQIKIVNRDNILTEEDMKDILEAKSERDKGKYYTLDKIFK